MNKLFVWMNFTQYWYIHTLGNINVFSFGISEIGKYRTYFMSSDFFLWWYLYIRIIHKKINQNGITKRRYAARLTIFAQAPFLPACNGIAYRIAFFMFTFQLKNKRKVAKHLKTFYFTWCTYSSHCSAAFYFIW